MRGEHFNTSAGTVRNCLLNGRVMGDRGDSGEESKSQVPMGNRLRP